MLKEELIRLLGGPNVETDYHKNIGASLWKVNTDVSPDYGDDNQINIDEYKIVSYSDDYIWVEKDGKLFLIDALDEKTDCFFHSLYAAKQKELDIQMGK